MKNLIITFILALFFMGLSPFGSIALAEYSPAEEVFNEDGMQK